MIGQGSPSSLSGVIAHTRATWMRVLFCLALLVRLSWTTAALGQQPTMWLRIAWGGGAEQQWSGRISLSEGEFDSPRLLGLEADEPGSMVLSTDRRNILIRPRSPRIYDGLDLPVSAPLDATLYVELWAPGKIRSSAQLRLRDVLSKPHNTPLDNQNNRLLVRRSPGDKLRIKLDRTSLVYGPGEAFQFQVHPHQLGLAEGASVRLQIDLVDKNSSKKIFSEVKELQADSDGHVAGTGPLEIVLPKAEGVYDLVLELAERTRNLFSRTKLAHRKVQLIVIDKQSPGMASSNLRPQLVDEFDPANPKWWDRMARTPQWKMIPGFGQGPLGNGKPATRKYLGRRMVELAVGGWQAYPLPIKHPGTPHILEVEYPSEVSQSLGISIVEPNAAGVVEPFGLDSGFHVPASADGGTAGIARHRLIFWPRTKTPLVLMTNRHDSKPAVYGKIRLVRPPDDSLPFSTAQRRGPQRLLAAYFDKPLFPENFSAPGALDLWTGRSLDDWNTFHAGGLRLIEYLRHVGYNGAMISVLCEGSTLYPSQLLEPTPKYDTGVMFTTGQDPVRKDVLEMLLRLFDREGLKLIPMIEFSTPLPALERKLRRGGPDKVGLELVDADGWTYLERVGTRQGKAPYYNPLDWRVQEEMLQVVRELLDRYATHPSLAGIAIQISPDGFAQLPGTGWGYDDRTIQRFEREASVNVPGVGPQRFAERARYLTGPGREKWLAWRANTLTEFYKNIHGELISRRKDAQLYLAGADMLKSPAVNNALRPTLPRKGNVEQAFLEIGIDTMALGKVPGIVPLRPHRTAPLNPLAEQAVNLEINNAQQIDRLFAAARPGSLFFHEPQKLRLESLDAVSPFGKEKTYTWLAAQMPPSGIYNRQRFVHALARQDSLSVMDGGWMLPLGQEDALRELYEVYRGLPDTRFTTFDAAKMTGKSTQPVTVRTLSQHGQTYLYLLNDSPWPVTAELMLGAARDVRLAALGSARQLPRLEYKMQNAWWTVKLKPYDMIGGVLNRADVTVEDCFVTLPEEVVPGLRNRIRDMGARIASLKNPRPLPVLENPGLELPATEKGIAGWVHFQGAGIQVELDQAVQHGGAQSMKLTSRAGNGWSWIRSDPFKPPKTGRLSVLVWLKIDDARRQPLMRLAIEGQHLGKTYYRYGRLGAGQKAEPLSAEWASYLFPVDDLPASGLEDLRVGFDLFGPGEIWIDDVQVFNLPSIDNERTELLKIVALADKQLRDGKVGDCARVLDGYWPRLLAEHVPLANPHIAEIPPRHRQPATVPQNKEAPSMMDRVRDQWQNMWR